MLTLILEDEQQQEGLGARLAALLPAEGMMIYLQGELGAGKTTLVRGLLRGLGYMGRVKSPTYTLVESYPLGERTLHHLDLYRLADAEELEYLGLGDLQTAQAVFLVEWPERGQGVLPAADLVITIEHLRHGRRLELRPGSVQGERLCQGLQI